MRLALLAITLLMNTSGFAADIASCSDPEGYAYFPETGLVGKEGSGWSADRISGGIVKLVKLSDGEYDVLFVDATKDIISARGDGATILPLNVGESAFSVLVVYPGKTAEVFTFLRTTSGGLEFLHVTSRAGDEVPIAKVGVMRGPCSYIHFGEL